MTTDTSLDAIVAEACAALPSGVAYLHGRAEVIAPIIGSAILADRQARADIIAQAVACFDGCDLDPLAYPELWRAYALLRGALGEGE